MAGLAPATDGGDEATFSLVGSTDLETALGLLGLSSLGVAVDEVSVSGDTVTAKAGTREVFSLEVAANGDYTFTLLDQLDHDTLNDITGDDEENTEVLDLGAFVQASDFDGDTIVLSASAFQITVIDDIPIQEEGTVTGTVEEEQLTGGNEDLVSGPPDLDLDTATTPLGSDVTTEAVSGSLATLVSVGTDEVTAGGGKATFSLVGSTELLAALAALGLTSLGEAVDAISLSGTTVTAKAGTRFVADLWWPVIP